MRLAFWGLGRWWGGAIVWTDSCRMRRSMHVAQGRGGGGEAAANAANGWVAPESQVCAKLRPEEAISMDDNLAAFKQTYANNPDYYAWYEAVEPFLATSTLPVHLRNIYSLTGS